MWTHETFCRNRAAGFVARSAQRSPVAPIGAFQMTINSNWGQFCLDMWEDPSREDVEALSEYSDNLDDLRAYASKLFAGGRFRWLELSRWIGPSDEDWELIEVYN